MINRITGEYISCKKKLMSFSNLQAAEENTDIGSNSLVQDEGVS